MTKILRVLSFVTCTCILASVTAESSCISEKPPECVVTPLNQPIDDKEICSIKNSMVSGDNTKIVSIGEAVEFTWIINKTYQLDPFINGCLNMSICKVNENGTLRTLTCSFQNPQLTDNGTKISVFVFNLISGYALCFNESSLLVKEDIATTLPSLPEPPVVTQVETRCGTMCVHVETNISLSNDTVVSYTLTRDDLNISTGTSNRTDICFAQQLFNNQSGEYWVSLHIITPYGSSNGTDIIMLHLGGNNTGSLLNFSAISVRVSNDNFYALATVKYNNNQCNQTVVTLSSNCSDGKTITINIPSNTNSQVVLNLTHNKKLCEINLTRSGTSSVQQKFIESTFHVQDVSFANDNNTNKVNITCTLINGSSALGCYLVINDTLFYNIPTTNNNNNNRLQLQAKETIDLKSPGMHHFAVYDWLQDGQYSSSSSFNFTVITNGSIIPNNTNTNYDAVHVLNISVIATLLVILFIALATTILILVVTVYYCKYHRRSKAIDISREEKGGNASQYKKSNNEEQLDKYLTVSKQENGIDTDEAANIIYQ